MAGYAAIGKVDMRSLGKELRQRVSERKGDPLWVAAVPKGYEIRDPSGDVVAVLNEQGFQMNPNNYDGLHNTIEMIYMNHTR